MKPYGYITLKEASELSGVAIETLKKQCQSGRLRGAIKEEGLWLVPRDEIIIKPVKPGHSDDDALVILVILAEAAGVGINITVYMNGLIIEGMLISTQKYITHMRENVNLTHELEDPETLTLVNGAMNTWYDNILKKNQDSGYEYIHLQQATVKQGGDDYEPIGTLLRLRIDAIDGFQLGTTKKFTPTKDVVSTSTNKMKEV